MAAESLTRRKTIEESVAGTEEEGFRLKRELKIFDVVVFGIGIMVGAGIFVLTGQAAAEEAGPAITISFIVAGVVAALAALCYAEFASMVPVAGSAYTFSYASLGELLAFIIGWDLVLEFTIGASAVAVGFGGYLNALLDSAFGISLPDAIAAPPGEGGVFNVPAVLLILVLLALLVRGVKLTSRANIVLVAITLVVLALVIGFGITEIDTGNWSPFFPFGFEGVIGGAALIFFAFIGFDVVATTAEETSNPQRDMPRGILGSLAIVTAVYFAVALVITGMVPFRELAGEAPIAEAFEGKGLRVISSIIFVGALVATAKTTMGLLLGQTRVGFAMSRDRLLPSGLARTHRRFGTPHRLTLVVGALVIVLAGLVPLGTLAELVNIGTLFAFVLVAAGVLYLRRTEPDRHRPFRAPFSPFVPLLTIAASIYLMASLEGSTWLRFGIWMALGLVVYFLYSRSRSVVARREA
jgi:basic amino acid/polyamine antiporter, APA family